MTLSAPPPPSTFKPLPRPRRLTVPYLAGGANDVLPAGTAVEAGQSLAPACHPSAPAPLAAVAGRVTGVTRVQLLDGRAVTAIQLETNETPAPVEASPPAPQPARAGDSALRALESVSRDDLGAWVERLRLGGVWADRWTSPDLLGQLHAALRRPVDAVVCNGLDIDPALPLNARLVAEHALEVVAATALLGRLCGTDQVLLVAGDTDDGDDLTVASGLARTARVEFVKVRNEYPQAHPTMLLHHLLERKLRPGHLPTDQGVLLLDAAAAVAVGRRFLYGEPMLAVPVGVYDGPRRSPHHFAVPVGTSLGDIFAAAGASLSGLALCAGGPLRDLRVSPGAVVGGGSELTAYALRPPAPVAPDPCIRSGWCIEACPVHIHPAGILQAAQRADRAAAEAYGLGACIECGICSYVCPSRLPLLPGVRVVKG